MTDDWKPGTIALIEAGCHANRKVAIRTGTPVNMGWTFSSDDKATPTWVSDKHGTISVVRPLVVVDTEDRDQVERLRVLASEWADRVPYSDMREEGDLTHLDAMQTALREFALRESADLPDKVYREHKTGITPWPVVGECFSSRVDGHECPQCAWVHEHDWVAWTSSTKGSAWPPFGTPIRCTKCGGRKCDREDCAEQRHGHTHADEVAG